MSDIQPPSRRIQALQAILWRLQGEEIPDKIQIDIDSALEHLDAISQVLVSGEEHSRLAALYRVSQVLGTSLDLGEVLNQVMDAVIGLTGAERGFIMLMEEMTDELVVQVGRNMEQETLQREEMKYSRTVIKTVLESGKGVVTTNAQEDPRFSEQESVISLALRSILCAPLRARGLVIGAIYVDNRAQVGLFNEADLEMLDAFASQAAAAIENARLYTRTDQSLAERVQELERLARFAREVNLHENEDEVLATTRQWALEGTNADHVWIAMLTKESGEQKITVAIGPGEGETLNPDHPLMKPVLDGNTPYVFEPKGDAPARLAVPIMGERMPIGILVAEA